MSAAAQERESLEPIETPSYQVSAYTVFPAGYRSVPEVPDREAWCLAVTDAGDGWAVRWRARCLDYRGLWQFEPPAEVRTAEFLRRCRFSEQAALQRARREVDDLVVDGRTFAEHVATFRAEQRTLAREVLQAHKRSRRTAQPTRGPRGHEVLAR